MQKNYNKIVIMILLFIFVISVSNTVFAESKEISGLRLINGGQAYCEYFSENNNCVLSTDANYIISSNFITIENQYPNLLISADIIIIQDLNFNQSVTFKDFNSIKINSGKSLTIDNNSLSSINLTFNNVDEIKIENSAVFSIFDNKLQNISEFLNNNTIIGFDSNISGSLPENIINLHSGNINLENTKMIVLGNLDIDLNKNIILSNNLPNNCNLTESNYVFVGMFFPEPEEDGEENGEIEDDNSTTEDFQDDLETICYKYFKFDSCNDYNSPTAKDSNSVYLCYNFLSEDNQIKIKDINASNNSEISIFSQFKLKRNILSGKQYYIGNNEFSTYESFDTSDENDPIESQSDFFFENYSGKIPAKLDNRGIGGIIFQTCGPLIFLSNNPDYNTCRFIFVRPENFNYDLNNTNASTIATFFKYFKNCSYQSLQDQVSNYLLIDSNQTISPMIFGNIINSNTGNTISPSFTLQGLYDINTTVQNISGINKQLMNNNFIFYLDPHKEKTLNILKNYQFKFILDANADLNYSDIDLYYPFKLYK